MADVYVRFECGQEDRVGEELGPFPFVQLTYNELRFGPDGETLAVYDREADVWVPTSEVEMYSDVVIYSKPTAKRQIEEVA